MGGHPIVGDCAYSVDKDSFRMFLHAHKLEMQARGALTKQPLRGDPASAALLPSLT